MTTQTQTYTIDYRHSAREAKKAHTSYRLAKGESVNLTALVAGKASKR